MSNRKPVVVVTRKLPEPIETRMRELFDVHLNADDHPFDRSELIEAVRTADVLVPTVTDRIDAGVLSQSGPALRLIANFGVGVDHIDLASARMRGITVTNTPDALTEDTADIAIALILAVPRRLQAGAKLLRSGEWSGWSPTGMLGHRLSGKRLGVIGMGRIGQAVARRAKAFGMVIHYHNRRRLSPEVEADLGATYWESLDQMLARMDVVTLHCPHTPATFHLLSARRLALLPRHAYLVNCARGEIVDEAALTRMLARGDLAGAGLDVFTREPEINPALLALENVVLLPHLASATHEGRIDMGEAVLVNIKIFTAGHPPPDRVVAAML